MPKRYEGGYGDVNNGFYLDFSDNSSTASLGIDKSPNGNDFTSNNFAVSDSVPDTPTNNWCTLNPLNSFGGTVSSLSNGLLQFNLSNNNHYPLSTLLIPETGRWYAEALVTSIGNDQATWIVSNPELQQNSSGTSATNRHNAVNYYRTDLRVDDSDNQVEVTDGSQVNNIIGILIDRDEGTVAFKNNNSNVGNPVPLSAAAGSTETLIIGVGNGSGSQGPQGLFNFGQDSSFAGNKTAQGKTDASGLGDFYYEPPAGYRALCAKNIAGTSSPTVRPQKHFGALLYTGDGSSSNKVTGLEFKPNLVWIKSRSATTDNVLQDTVRGNHIVYSNSNAADGATGGGWVKSFNLDGFTTDVNGPINTDSATYVAWCWKGGGNSHTYNIDGVGYASVSAAGLDGGTINPTGASINTEAGFSIITYSGSGSETTGTIAHGLGKVPKFAMIKRRDSTGNWMVYHENIGNTHNLYLNTTDVKQDDSHAFNDTSPTSSLFTVGISGFLHAASGTYVAYFWAEVPGYSKFGEWTGNGSSQAAYVYTGFRPAFLMYKATNGAHDWRIFDATRDVNNGVNTRLRANTTDAEDTHGGMDFTSNGFRIRNGTSGNNGGGEQHVFMAFAEQPGKTPFSTFANAR